MMVSHLEQLLAKKSVKRDENGTGKKKVKKKDR
jgi:hypothetical protein